MNVFVTGGGGFIGSRVCGRLIARGDRVTILARTDERSARDTSATLQRVTGDLENLAFLEQQARDADAVIHLALAPGQRAGDIDRGAISAFRRGLANSGKVFVHTSAAGIIGDTHGQIVDEGYAPQPSPAVRWRAENEAYAREAATENVRVAVIRPAPIVHDRDHAGSVVDAMRRSGANGPVPYVEGGTGRWSTVHVDDVADLYVRVLDGGKAGDVYFAASDEFVTNAQLAEAVARGGPTRVVDLAEARGIFAFFADLARTDIMVSGAKARAFLRWAPAGTPLLEELQRAPQPPASPESSSIG